MSSPTPLAVVAAFLERCCEDLERGGLLPLADYLRFFPGHEAVLTAEYEALVADEDASTADADPAAASFEAGAVLAARLRLGRDVRRDGATVVRDAIDESTGDRLFVRWLRADTPGFALGRERLRALGAAGQRAPDARAAGALLPVLGGEDGGGYWIATPAPRGVPFRAGPLPVAEAVRSMELAADAVARAKSAGVVHGDLRPSRLFEAPDGAVQAIDFGLAPSPGEGWFGPALVEAAADGSRYRSPARLRGGAATAADDAHALAVILYERLTGRPPFDAPTDEALARVVQAGRPAALRGQVAVSAALENAVLRALHPSTAHPDAAAFADALRAARAAGPVDRPSSFWSRVFGR